MCGICGIWHFASNEPVDAELLARMTRQFAHRGPDEEGFHREGGVGLGFRRLGVIDLATSHQPMPNEDGSLRLVANGEIYNFQELRDRLTPRHTFRTQGDIETILHAYEEHGADCVHQFRGMFAFAIWDRGQQRMTLAVDRFGKKPLYYALDGKKLVFGSELKCLREHPGIGLDLDYAALDEYLSTGYIRAPRSIYRAIRKLPPGHTLTVAANGGSRLAEYWHPRLCAPPEQSRASIEELAAELRERLLEAVRLRMISDVPLGAFLSGGIDSSIVVGLMSRLSSRPVKTFSIGFEGDPNDESPYARAVAAHCGTDHVHEIVRPDVVDILPRLVRHYDEPFADNSMIPTYYVSVMARKAVTVALSGDGGDEVFAGYQWYRRAYRHRRLQAFLPDPIRPAVARLARAFPPDTTVYRYLGVVDRPPTCWGLAQEYFERGRRARLYNDWTRAQVGGSDADAERDAILESVKGLGYLSQLQYADLVGFLPGDGLVKVDRASMLASLEVRSPLLDHVVFEFMARVPPHCKLDGRESKILLKRAAGEVLPPSILTRRKRGFDLPAGEWLRGPLRPMLEDMLLGPGARIAAFLDQTGIRRLASEHAAGRTRHDSRLWALLCLELWLREFAQPKSEAVASRPSALEDGGHPPHPGAPS